jgi:hypothetical protein
MFQYFANLLSSFNTSHVSQDPSHSSSFKHSGDLGDIIFSIPVIQALKGGVLFLDPDGGRDSPHVQWADKNRTKLNCDSIMQIMPFLKLQHGIFDVKIWSSQSIDYDLDQFRLHIKHNNICLSHLRAFKLSPKFAQHPWLNFPSIRTLKKPYLIARSVRYHGNYSFWEEILPKIAADSLFIGFKKDHEIFEYTFGHPVEYYETPTIMDLAETIHSCKKIYCNQGLPHAIAEGLHKELVCEKYRVYPSAVFDNKASSVYV